MELLIRSLTQPKEVEAHESTKDDLGRTQASSPSTWRGGLWHIGPGTPFRIRPEKAVSYAKEGGLRVPERIQDVGSSSAVRLRSSIDRNLFPARRGLPAVTG